MATILASAATSILATIGKSILSKGASYALEKGLVSISGGTETDRIRKDIANVLTEVHQIQTSVEDLSTQLSSSLLQLRQDSLTVYITDIETYYTTVSDILQEAFELPSKKLPEAEHIKQGNALQNRLDSRLQASADTIPGYLDQMNAFLNQKGPTAFFKQAAQQALDDSEDFLGYYTKTKVMALNYWIAYAKGISLLQMAQQAANVHFEEGSYTINRHNTNLELQQQNFEDTVGHSAIALAEGIIANPEAEHPFIWRSTSNTYIQSFATVNDNWVRSNVEKPTASWLMKPRYPVAVNKFDLTGSYAVWVEPTDQPGHNLFLNGGSAAGLETIFPLENADGGAWLIKPRYAGSDRFSFSFISGYVGGLYNHYYIIDIDIGSGLRKLYYAKDLDKDDMNMFFNVTLGEL
ncbi:hypothetical protein FANTH_13944 [Fusarium anthophilum]|uniref:Uncharacterized protein n=1 Tax=Fusarium anthophilum TaxID=48485 RepID=A0A8H4YL70_9HYPO|nr:hypothetical protein FANTH_13944 [Fusarium anthophilum]